MPVNRSEWLIIALIGLMYLMLATATTINAGVDVALDINVAFDGEKAVCTCDLKTNVDLKMPDTCENCSGRMSNKTWLTYEPKESSSQKPTPETTKPKIMDFRIPTDLYPLLYEVELFPNMTDSDPANFTFEGYVKIWMTCKNATDKLTLHSKSLKVDPNSIIFSGEPSVVSHKYDTDRDFLILQLDTKTIVGQKYSVQMNFTSPLKNDSKGLYYSEYKSNETTVFLAVSNLQPHDARRVFPCFDEPAIKATFDITLVRPINYTSLSNMPLKETKTIESSIFEKDVFVTTPMISTYLLAFVVSDFTYIENTTKNGVLFRVWSRPDVINQTKYSFDVGFEVLSYFEDIFNIVFPLPKLDSVAVPNLTSNAMENWGLILYVESSMLKTEDNSVDLAKLVSKEIAHQWFGNLVSPAWWDANWLNKGLASFVSYLGVDFYHPDWSVFENFIQKNHLPTCCKDTSVSSRPLYLFDYHPNESSTYYDKTTDKMSAAVILMMRHFIGFDTFTKGLTLYLTSHQYSVATQDDLWSALTEQARLDGKAIDVKEVMDTWTLQMNYPLVTVSHDSKHKGVLRVEQERFLENPNATDLKRYVSPFNYTWNIPLTFISSKTENFNESDLPIYWIKKNETSKLINVSELLPSNDTWFICNFNLNGYYRVNYDRSNWMALAKQLKENHEVIPVINRYQIINDVWALAKRNLLPRDTLFSILDYVENETHYLPLGQALNALSHIGDLLSLSPIYWAFLKFMNKTISKPYQYLEEKSKTTNLSSSEISLRKNLLKNACFFSISICVDDARLRYSHWMENPNNNTFDQVYRNARICQAIAHGGEKEWNFMLEMYNNGQEKSYIGLCYLGACTRLPWILSKFLQMSIENNSSIPNSDAVYIPVCTSWNIVGRSLTWNFFRENFHKLKELYRGKEWNLILENIPESFNTEVELKELKAFKQEQEGNFGSGETKMQEAIEKVEKNVQWMKTHYNEVAAWLKANVN